MIETITAKLSSNIGENDNGIIPAVCEYIKNISKGFSI